MWMLYSLHPLPFAFTIGSAAASQSVFETYLETFSPSDLLKFQQRYSLTEQQPEVYDETGALDDIACSRWRGVYTNCFFY